MFCLWISISSFGIQMPLCASCFLKWSITMALCTQRVRCQCVGLKSAYLAFVRIFKRSKCVWCMRRARLHFVKANVFCKTLTSDPNEDASSIAHLFSFPVSHFGPSAAWAGNMRAPNLELCTESSSFLPTKVSNLYIKSVGKHNV